MKKNKSNVGWKWKKIILMLVGKMKKDKTNVGGRKMKKNKSNVVGRKMKKKKVMLWHKSEEK